MEMIYKNSNEIFALVRVIWEANEEKQWQNGAYSPRARGVLFVLKGPYDLRVPPIVKISQESESARLTKIILSKSTVKTL